MIRFQLADIFILYEDEVRIALALKLQIVAPKTYWLLFP